MKICKHLALFAVAVAILAIPTASNNLLAQTTRGRISGTATDPSRAVIPGVAITVHNKGTGAEEHAVTDAVGRYLFAELAVGIYDLKASKGGFQTLQRNDLNLTVGSQAVVDFPMPVGQTQETVTVQGEVPQVDTTTSAVSNTVEQVQMSNLPLNGRNLTDLISLSPGIASGGSVGLGANPSVIYGKQSNFSVSGSRPEGQAYLIDNQNIQNFYNHGAGSAALGTTLGVEAINEFQILTSNYSAQFGGNGATVNAVSKSGTNGFHGSAYEYLRNSALDARDFFDGARPPEFRQNQFGFSLGGPIKKDKLFFFFNYEGFYQALGQSKVAIVPDADAHGGIVNGVNVGVSPLTANILKLYPLPTVNIGNGVGQLTTVATQKGHENYLFARGDYNMGSKDSLTMRWIMDRAYLNQPFAGSPLPPFYNEIATQKNQFGTVEWRRIMSTSVVNLLRLNLSHTPERDYMLNLIPSGTDALVFFPERGQVGNVSIGGGISLLGGSQFPPVLQSQVKIQVGDDLVWTKGSHLVKIGGSLERIRTNQAPYGYYGGGYTFASLTTFLKGTPSRFIGPIPGQTDPYRDFREIDYVLYANDEWKILPKLTLNLGVRYSPTTNPTTNKHPLTALTSPPYGTGFEPVTNIWAANPSLRNIDPRVGFAYDPFNDHKTSIRGGFGVFHNVIQARSYSSGYYYNPPYTVATINFPAFPNPFVSGYSTGIISQGQGVDYSGMKTPYMMQWNLSIQRQLMESTVLTVAYVGSRGNHLFVQRDLNSVTPKTAADGTIIYGTPRGATTVGIASNPRVNPTFSSLTSAGPLGFSQYHGLQLGLNRRLSRNVQTQFSYTWSRSLDIGSGNYGLEGGTQPTNPYSINSEYGPSAFNRKHVLKLSGLYTLPFKGNQLVEGWQVSAIFTKQSGAPFNPIIGFDQSGSLVNNQRPNLVAGRTPDDIILGTDNVTKYANATAFSLPEPGKFGNLSRNAFYGPGFINADFSVLKETYIRSVSEDFRVQFRAEFFNIANHPNFGAPNATVFVQAVNGGATYSSTFGKITNTNGTARQIQFGLKLIF